jgi:hypothetical protein
VGSDGPEVALWVNPDQLPLFKGHRSTNFHFYPS